MQLAYVAAWPVALEAAADAAAAAAADVLAAAAAAAADVAVAAAAVAAADVAAAAAQLECAARIPAPESKITLKDALLLCTCLMPRERIKYIMSHKMNV